MAKKTKNKEEEKPETPKHAEIIGGKIKDDFCDFSYIVQKGIGTGFTHNVKGRGIVKDDMLEAFSKFNVHLAVLDDVFKHADVEIKNIDKMHTHELALLYQVHEFKIKGPLEDECIILYGTKHATNGRIALESQKIALDNVPSYEWAKELKKAADAARFEVEEYKNGKYTEVEPEEKPDKNQLSITAELGEDAHADNEFENAEV